MDIFTHIEDNLTAHFTAFYINKNIKMFEDVFKNSTNIQMNEATDMKKMIQHEKVTTKQYFKH